MKAILLVALSLLLVACSEQSTDSTGAVSVAPKVERNRDFAQITRGAKIFTANCAQCHGDIGQGGPNWRQRDASGRFPPPPLNGTGHAWHHPEGWLKNMIMNGSPDGSGRMPAWKESLSEQEINDVMAWFISKWPGEVYEAWYGINQRVKNR
ncbi:MAG: cytochrome c [Gammaproteobacteria bacterium]|nr:cytochrome c [Gammaproteobacteria bacterium]